MRSPLFGAAALLAVFSHPAAAVQLDGAALSDDMLTHTDAGFFASELAQQDAPEEDKEQQTASGRPVSKKAHWKIA